MVTHSINLRPTEQALQIPLALLAIGSRDLDVRPLRRRLPFLLRQASDHDLRRVAVEFCFRLRKGARADRDGRVLIGWLLLCGFFR